MPRKRPRIHPLLACLTGALGLLAGCGGAPAQRTGPNPAPEGGTGAVQQDPLPDRSMEKAEMQLTLPGRIGAAPPGAHEVVEAWRAGAAPAFVEPVFVDDLGLELPAGDWQQADLDGDGTPEWVGIVRGAQCTSDPRLWIVGLDGRILERDACQPHAGCGQPCDVIRVTDLTGDALDDVVVRTVITGAHTETMLYRVISAHGGVEPRNVVVVRDASAHVADAAEMSYATEAITDATRDGVADLVLEGGLIGSAGAGRYQRQRRDVWSWDGAQVVRVETQKAPTDLRVFVLYDAHDAMAAGDDARAVELYTQVLESDALRDVEVEGHATRPQVRQLAAFRLALLALERGERDAAQRWQAWLAANHPQSHFARAADRLLEVWSGSRAEACAAVTEQLMAEKVDWRPLSDMGYANPALDADDVCPAP